MSLQCIMCLWQTFYILKGFGVDLVIELKYLVLNGNVNLYIFLAAEIACACNKIQFMVSLQNHLFAGNGCECKDVGRCSSVNLQRNFSLLIHYFQHAI